MRAVVDAHSPPSHPVTSAMHTATPDRKIAVGIGARGLGRRSNQLTMKSSVTMTFPHPCHTPMARARVLRGIESQSTKPKTAAASPISTPAKIIQNETSARSARPVIRYAMSKKNDVARSPRGNTTSIW
jgi:hypothetical protein